ncbi:hypothetical protein HMPREF2531_02071 [Bacteroides intestinalis]|uniref:Uncharacterized protein n=2 Tax=Bacteroides TaxID=816 RepID=A0A139LIQ7_9BACE|nr:hypothetical protein BACCELL_02067 [Bacteroides cellulosilyticus DSM 14838]KXT51283.1 hypothetical protein HMPREF2531_02071 [Bacteroides intestinalis]
MIAIYLSNIESQISNIEKGVKDMQLFLYRAKLWNASFNH